MEFEFDHSDGFDRTPDPLIHLIFNQISDIKTLIRCRSVSKRFNSLVPQADSLLLRVDRVISATDSDDDDDSFLIAILRSIIKSLHHLVSPSKPLSNPTRSQNSPAQILREFEKIRNLQIELPSGDLRLEKGTTIRWTADFGKTLKSCVILGFRSGDGGGGEAELGGGGAGGGLKMRVVWTISALIAASARHYMMVEVVNEHKELENLVIKDREDEGKVVMDKKGLRECRESQGEGEEAEVNNASSGNGVGLWWRSNRTTVPAVRMRMRHEARMELSCGTKMVGATLVVVRPINQGNGGGERNEVEEQTGDVGLALGAFGEDAVYCEAVERLLKSRSYILEMNSF